MSQEGLRFFETCFDRKIHTACLLLVSNEYLLVGSNEILIREDKFSFFHLAITYFLYSMQMGISQYINA